MNKLKRLLKSYSQFIELPWRNDAAAAQRVIFCVYDETDELQLRYRLDEFELATKQAGHDWACTAVMATVLTTSATVHPRLKSLTGLLSPCKSGPIATAPEVRCTAL